MASLATTILSARRLVGDGPTDNLVRNENLNNPDIGNVIDGSNRLFAVQNFPMSPRAQSGGVVLVVADGVSEALTNYSVNEPTGQITLNSAPQNTLYGTYYFYLMDDPTWTEFVVSAIERLNLSTGAPDTDLANMPEGLLVVVKQYACANWAQRMAGQTGLWYNQRLQERDEQRENISRKFQQLAKQMFENGDTARDNFYKGTGSQYRPGIKIIQHLARPWTPRA